MWKCEILEDKSLAHDSCLQHRWNSNVFWLTRRVLMTLGPCRIDAMCLLPTVHRTGQKVCYISSKYNHTYRCVRCWNGRSIWDDWAESLRRGCGRHVELVWFRRQPCNEARLPRVRGESTIIVLIKEHTVLFSWDLDGFCHPGEKFVEHVFLSSRSGNKLQRHWGSTLHGERCSGFRC